MPNTTAVELLLLFPLCILSAALFYGVAVYAITLRRKQRTLPLYTLIESPTTLHACEQEYWVLRRKLLHTCRCLQPWMERAGRYVRHTLSHTRRHLSRHVTQAVSSVEGVLTAVQ